MTADALTPYSSRAELWLKYHRKAIIAFLPVLLGALNVIRDSAQTPDGVNASTIVVAVLTAAGLVATYVPDNARAKLFASAILAIGSGVTAAVTSGISLATVTVVLSQLIAWAVAGLVENGPRPDVAVGMLPDPLV